MASHYATHRGSVLIDGTPRTVIGYANGMFTVEGAGKEIRRVSVENTGITFSAVEPAWWSASPRRST